MEQVVTPHLERLSIDMEGVMMLDKGVLHLDPENIKYLRLQDFNDIDDSDAASAFNFFPKKVPLPNIQMLVVTDSSFKDIFPTKKPEIIHSQLLAQELELRNLHKLESIGLEHTWVTFSDLTWLKVEGCASLKYLFTSSAAKCLVQLEQLHISNCEALESLMMDYPPRDDDHDVIIFERLKKLSLSQIPKLESFYKGNSTLNFPSLEEVEVTECNRLEYMFTFSTTKSLHKLGKMEISKCESLKTVILAAQEEDKSHEDLITFSDLGNLSFSKLPKLESFYKGMSTLNFPSLKEVEVTECNRLEYMFTFSTAKSLHKLWNMEISKCKSLKTVVLAEADEPHELTFSCLWNLSLSELPKLESFFFGNSSTMNFPSLKEVKVTECNKLEYMFTFSTAKSLENLHEMKISKCESLETIVLATQEANKQHEDLTFPDLEYLTLNELPKLESFFTKNSSTLNFPRFGFEVCISQCKIMKTFSEGHVEAPKLWKVEIDGVRCWKDNLNAVVSQQFEEQMKQH